jgi:APA family basic amino acid/polyamine antiporter
VSATATSGGPRSPGGSPPAPPDGAGEHGGLQRVLGVPALFSAAYGNVGSSIYYALGLVAGFALGLTPVAFLVSGLFFVATALTYAEGTTAYPEAGGASSFARHAFNELVSFVTAWAQLLNFVITMSISAFFVPHYLGVFWEPLKSSPADSIGAIVVIALLATLNIIGIEETAAVTVALALADFGTQVLLALLGMLLLFDGGTLVANVHLGIAPTWKDFVLGITLSMIAYTGIETISNMAEETRDPIRAVPRAIGWVVAAVMSLYVILPVVALSALPVRQSDDGTYYTKLGLPEPHGYAGDPFIGLVRAFDLPAEWMRTALEGYVGVLAAVILFIATNAGVIGVSRLSYSMAQYRQMPDRLRTLHPTRLTPWVSIMIFCTIGALLVTPPLVHWYTDGAIGISGPKENEVLGNLYAFGAMLSFSIAHISVFWMRWRGDERPWSAPLGMRIAGRSIPMFAVVGLIGTGGAWIVQVATHPLERAIGVGWMLIGPVVYVLYRRSQGLTLTDTVRAPVVVPPPSVDVAYQSIMVPVLGARLDHGAMVLACKVAGERGAQIVVAGVLEVPQSLPLHAELGDIEVQLNRELDLAREIAQEFGVDVVTRVLRTRRGEMAVLEEALRRETQLIVLGVSPRRHLGLSLVGRTNERIMRRSPVRVLIVREKDDYILPGQRGIG